MMASLNAPGNRQILCIAVALFSISLSANAAPADSPAPERAQVVGSKSGGTVSRPKQPGSDKEPVQKQAGKPDGAGNFVYGLINQIRAQSEELCARYGNPSDCLEEAEVCLTMRDTDDNQVKMCLNTIPESSGSNEGAVQKSRLRRQSR